jgi:biotin carboxylase
MRDLLLRYEQLLDSRTEDLSRARSSHMILEEYLDGDAYTVTCVLSYGSRVYATVADETPQPYMVRTGVQMPSEAASTVQEELIDLAYRVLDALGFKSGVFAVEMRHTTHGAQLIEVNTTVQNTAAYPMNKAVWGVDLVDQYLLTCLGVPVRPLKADVPQAHLAACCLVAPYSGVVTEGNFLRFDDADAQVFLLDTQVQRGQRVTGPDGGVPDTLGTLMVCGGSSRDARRALQARVVHLDVPIQPVGA